MSMDRLVLDIGLPAYLARAPVRPDLLCPLEFGHCLLDAFPFQHPEAPDLSVSIPVGDASGRGAAGRARLFGQGASGSFGNFTTLTVTGPAGRSDIVSALVAARS
jgi:hypothetical protein